MTKRFFCFVELVTPDSKVPVVDGSWEGVDRETPSLTLFGSEMKSLEPLLEFQMLEKLWVGHVNDNKAAPLWSLSSLKELTLRDCRLSSLQGVSQLTNLTKLTLWGSTKLTSLEGLDKLESLETLIIEHIPKVESLDVLTRLPQLKRLVIHSSTGSEKNLIFDSFEPLSHLHSLEVFDLAGVVPQDGSLEPIGRLQTLEQLYLGNLFSIAEVARLAACFPKLKADCLQPYSEVHGGQGALRCKKCGTAQIMLHGKKGKRSRLFVCPTCHAKVVEEHDALFRSIVERS